MTSDTSRKPTDCEAFQQQLPEFFDAEKDLIEHPHLKSCENCSSLVRDLNYIEYLEKMLLPLH